MARRALRRRIQEIIAEQNVGKVDVGPYPTTERFRVEIYILCRMHVVVDRIRAVDGSKTEDGNQNDHDSETNGQDKQDRTRIHGLSIMARFRRRENTAITVFGDGALRHRDQPFVLFTPGIYPLK